MIDERTPRTAGEELSLDGTSYRLHTGIPRRNGILYSATAAGPGLWEDILIRELFPKYAGIRRQADGTLSVPFSGAAALRQAREIAARGQQAEDAWLRVYGGRSTLIDAYGTSYVVRAFPRAIPLHAMLEQGSIPPETALSLLDQLLKTVEAVHNAGLLHLHIAPQTIYLFSGGKLILDYDFLFAQTQPEGCETTVRESAYGAPEVRLGNFLEICPASDLYSCCAVFCEMLLGRPLSEDDILGQRLPVTLRQALAESLDLPAPQLSSLTNLLCHGLHTLPHRRFQTAAELWQALALLRVPN